MGKKEQIAALEYVCGWCADAPVSSRRELGHLMCNGNCACARLNHQPNDHVRKSQSLYCHLDVDAVTELDPGLHPSIVAVANRYAEYGSSAKMHAILALRKAAKEVVDSSPAQIRGLCLAIGVPKDELTGLDKKALADLYKETCARKAAQARARENDEKRRQLSEARDASARKKEAAAAQTKTVKPEATKEKKAMTATMTTPKTANKHGDWKVGAKVVALTTKKHPDGRFNVKKDETFTIVRIEEKGRGAHIYVKGAKGGEMHFASGTPFFSVVGAATPTKKATATPAKKAAAKKTVTPRKPAAKKTAPKKTTAKKAPAKKR